MDIDRITGAAKDAAGKAESAIGNVLGDAETRASGKAREAEGTLQNLYGQAKDTARDVGDAASKLAHNALDNETLRDGTQAIGKSVKDNPLASLLVAGGIGFAVAMLMSRQPRRRWR